MTFSGRKWAVLLSIVFSFVSYSQDKNPDGPHISPDARTPASGLNTWRDRTNEKPIPFYVITKRDISQADLNRYLRQNQILHDEAHRLLGKERLTYGDIRNINFQYFYEAMRPDSFQRISPDVSAEREVPTDLRQSMQRVLDSMYLYSVSTGLNTPNPKKDISSEVLATAYQISSKYRDSTEAFEPLRGAYNDLPNSLNLFNSEFFKAVSAEVDISTDLSTNQKTLAKDVLRRWQNEGYDQLKPFEKVAISESIALMGSSSQSSSKHLGEILLQTLNFAKGGDKKKFVPLTPEQLKAQLEALAKAHKDSIVKWSWPSGFAAANPSMRANAKTLVDALQHLEKDELEKLKDYYFFKFQTDLSADIAKKGRASLKTDLARSLFADYFSLFQYTEQKFGVSNAPVEALLLADKAEEALSAPDKPKSMRFIKAIEKKLERRDWMTFDKLEEKISKPADREKLIKALPAFQFEPHLREELGLLHTYLSQYGHSPIEMATTRPVADYLAQNATKRFDPISNGLPERLAKMPDDSCPPLLAKTEGENLRTKDTSFGFKAPKKDGTFEERLADISFNVRRAYQILDTWKDADRNTGYPGEERYEREKIMAGELLDQFQEMLAPPREKEIFQYPVDVLLFFDRLDRVTKETAKYRFLAKTILLFENYKGDNSTVKTKAPDIAKSLRGLYETKERINYPPVEFRSLKTNIDIVMRECATSNKCEHELTHAAALLSTLASDSWEPVLPNMPDSSRRSAGNSFSMLREPSNLNYLAACTLHKAKVDVVATPDRELLSPMPDSPAPEMAANILAANRDKILGLLNQISRGQWNGELASLHQNVMGLPLPSDPSLWTSEAKNKMIDKLFADYLKGFQTAEKRLTKAEMMKMSPDILLLRDRASKDKKYTYFMARVESDYEKAKIKFDPKHFDKFSESADSRTYLRNLPRTFRHSELDDVSALLQAVMDDFGDTDLDRPDHYLARNKDNLRYLAGYQTVDRVGPPTTSWRYPRGNDRFPKMDELPFFYYRNDWSKDEAMAALNANAKLVFEGIDYAKELIAKSTRRWNDPACSELWKKMIVPLKISEAWRNFPTNENEFCFGFFGPGKEISNIDKKHWKTPYDKAVFSAIVERLSLGLDQHCWRQIEANQFKNEGKDYLLRNASMEAVSAYFLSGKGTHRDLGVRFETLLARAKDPVLLSKFLEESKMGRNGQDFFGKFNDDQRYQWTVENYRTLNHYHPDLGRLVALSTLLHTAPEGTGDTAIPRNVHDRIYYQPNSTHNLVSADSSHKHMLALDQNRRLIQGKPPFITSDDLITLAENFLEKRGKRLPRETRDHLLRWKEQLDQFDGRLVPGYRAWLAHQTFTKMEKFAPDQLDALLMFGNDRNTYYSRDDNFTKAFERWGSFKPNESGFNDQARWALEFISSGKANRHELGEIFDDYYRTRTGWSLSEEWDTQKLAGTDKPKEEDLHRLKRLLIEDQKGLATFFDHDNRDDSHDRWRISNGDRPYEAECLRWVKRTGKINGQRAVILELLKQLHYSRQMTGAFDLNEEAFDKVAALVTALVFKTKYAEKIERFNEEQGRKIAALYLLDNAQRYGRTVAPFSILTSKIRKPLSYDQFMDRFLGVTKPLDNPFTMAGPITPVKLAEFSNKVKQHIDTNFTDLTFEQRTNLHKMFVDMAPQWPSNPRHLLNRSEHAAVVQKFSDEYQRLKVTAPTPQNEPWIRRVATRYRVTDPNGTLTGDAAKLTDEEVRLLDASGRLGSLIDSHYPDFFKGQYTNPNGNEYLQLRKKELETDLKRIYGLKMVSERDPRCRGIGNEVYTELANQAAAELAQIDHFLNPPPFDRPNIDVGSMVASRTDARKPEKKSIFINNDFWAANAFWADRLRPDERTSNHIPKEIKEYLSETLCAPTDKRLEKLNSVFDVTAWRDDKQVTLKIFRKWLLGEMKRLNALEPHAMHSFVYRFGLSCSQSGREAKETALLALSNIVRQLDRSFWQNRGYQLRNNLRDVPPEVAALDKEMNAEFFGNIVDYKDLLLHELSRLDTSTLDITRQGERVTTMGPSRFARQLKDNHLFAEEFVGNDDTFINWIEVFLKKYQYDTSLGAPARSRLLALPAAYRRLLMLYLDSVKDKYLQGDELALLTTLIFSPSPEKIASHLMIRKKGEEPHYLYLAEGASKLIWTHQIPWRQDWEKDSVRDLLSDYAKLSSKSTLKEKDALRTRIISMMESMESFKQHTIGQKRNAAGIIELLDHLALLARGLDDAGHWRDGRVDPDYAKAFTAGLSKDHLSLEETRKALTAEAAAMREQKCSLEEQPIWTNPELMSNPWLSWIPTPRENIACTKLREYLKLLHADGKGMSAEARTKFLTAGFTADDFATLDRLKEIAKNLVDPVGAKMAQQKLHLLLSSPSRDLLIALSGVFDGNFQSFDQLVRQRQSLSEALVNEFVELAEKDQYQLVNNFYLLKVKPSFLAKLDQLSNLVSLSLAIERANRTGAGARDIKTWAKELNDGVNGQPGIRESLEHMMRRKAAQILLARAAAKAPPGETPMDQTRILASVAYRIPQSGDDASKPEFILYRRLRSLLDGTLPRQMEKRVEADIRLEIQRDSERPPKEVLDERKELLKALIDTEKREGRRAFEAVEAAQGRSGAPDFNTRADRFVNQQPSVVALQRELDRLTSLSPEAFKTEHDALKKDAEVNGAKFKEAVQARLLSNGMELVNHELSTLVGNPEDGRTIPRETVLRDFLRTNIKACVKDIFDKERENKTPDSTKADEAAATQKAKVRELQGKLKAKQSEVHGTIGQADMDANKALELLEDAERKSRHASDKDYKDHWTGKLAARQAREFREAAEALQAEAKAKRDKVPGLQKESEDLAAEVRKERLKLFTLVREAEAKRGGLPRVNEWRLNPETELALESMGDEGKRLTQITSQEFVDSTRLKQQLPSVVSKVRFFEAQVKQQKENLEKHARHIASLNGVDKEKAEAPIKYYRYKLREAQYEQLKLNAELEAVTDQEEMGRDEMQVYQGVNQAIGKWFDDEVNKLRRSGAPNFVTESKIRELLSDDRIFGTVKEAMYRRNEAMAREVRNYCTSKGVTFGTETASISTGVSGNGTTQWLADNVHFVAMGPTLAKELASSFVSTTPGAVPAPSEPAARLPVDPDLCKSKLEAFETAAWMARTSKKGDASSTAGLRLLRLIKKMEKQKLAEWLRDRAQHVQQKGAEDQQAQESVTDTNFKNKAKACLDHLKEQGKMPAIREQFDGGLWTEADIIQTQEALKSFQQADQDAEAFSAGVLPPQSARQDILQGVGTDEFGRVVSHPTARRSYDEVLKAYQSNQSDFTLAPHEAEARVRGIYGRVTPPLRKDAERLHTLIRDLSKYGFVWNGKELVWKDARLHEVPNLGTLKTQMEELGNFGVYATNGTNPWQVMTAEILATYINQGMTATIKFHKSAVRFNGLLYGRHGGLVTSSHAANPSELHHFISFKDPKDTDKQAQASATRLKNNLKKYAELGPKIREQSNSWEAFFEAGADLLGWLNPVGAAHKVVGIVDKVRKVGEGEMSEEEAWGTWYNNGTDSKSKNLIAERAAIEERITSDLAALHSLGNTQVEYLFEHEKDEGGRKVTTVDRQNINAKDLAGLYDYQHHYLHLEQGEKVKADAYKAYTAAQEFIAEWIAVELAFLALDVATAGASTAVTGPLRYARYAAQVAKGVRFAYRVTAATKALTDAYAYATESDPSKRQIMGWVEARKSAHHQAVLFGTLPILTPALGAMAIPEALQGPLSMFLMSETMGIAGALMDGNSMDQINWTELHWQSAQSSIYGINVNAGISKAFARMPLMQNSALARTVFGGLANWAAYRGISSSITIANALRKGYVIDPSTGQPINDPGLNDLLKVIGHETLHSAPIELTFALHAGKDIKQHMATDMVVSQKMSPAEVARVLSGPVPEPKPGEAPEAFQKRFEKYRANYGEVLAHAVSGLHPDHIDQFIEKGRLESTRTGEIDPETGLVKPSTPEGVHARRVVVELARQSGFVGKDGHVRGTDLIDFQLAYKAAKGHNPFLTWQQIGPRVQERGRAMLKQRQKNGELSTADYLSHPMINSGTVEAYRDVPLLMVREALAKPAGHADRVAAEKFLDSYFRNILVVNPNHAESWIGRKLAKLIFKEGKVDTASATFILNKAEAKPDANMVDVARDIKTPKRTLELYRERLSKETDIDVRRRLMNELLEVPIFANPTHIGEVPIKWLDPENVPQHLTFLRNAAKAHEISDADLPGFETYFKEEVRKARLNVTTTAPFPTFASLVAGYKATK